MRRPTFVSTTFFDSTQRDISARRDEPESPRPDTKLHDHQLTYHAFTCSLKMFPPFGMGMMGMGMPMPMMPMMTPMMPTPGVMPGVPGQGWYNSLPGRFGRDMLGRGTHNGLSALKADGQTLPVPVEWAQGMRKARRAGDDLSIQPAISTA